MMTFKQRQVCAWGLAGALGLAGQAMAQSSGATTIAPVYRTMDLPDATAFIGPMTIEAPALTFAFGQDRDKEAEQRERDRETRAYEQGRDYIDQGRYDRAIERLNDVVAMKGPRADAALYYRAWAQNKAGLRSRPSARSPGIIPRASTSRRRRRSSRRSGSTVISRRSQRIRTTKT
jgi:hypothetical protein